MLLNHVRGQPKVIDLTDGHLMPLPASERPMPASVSHVPPFQPSELPHLHSGRFFL